MNFPLENKQTDLKKDELQITGQFVISAIYDDNIRMFLFLNNLNGILQSKPCKGLIQIPIDCPIKQSKKEKKVSLIERANNLGVQPIISIEVTDLQGLDLLSSSSQSIQNGSLKGVIQIANVRKEIDLPLNLSLDDLGKISAEPVCGLNYSMSELAVVDEVATLMGIDPLEMEDNICIQFKLIISD